MEEKTFYLHLGKSPDSETTIWNEGPYPECIQMLAPLTAIQITFIFILILFIDSVNRVYRVQTELAAAFENNPQAG
jgi:hypothetical protein